MGSQKLSYVYKVPVLDKILSDQLITDGKIVAGKNKDQNIVCVGAHNIDKFIDGIGRGRIINGFIFIDVEQSPQTV